MDLGVSSVELIMLKQRLQTHFSPGNDIALTRLITNPNLVDIADTIRDLRSTETGSASTLDNSSHQPVIALSHDGSKSPLFLIHPGVGEILAFVPLAKHITDRPLYALRARGFEPGERPFTSIAEAIQILKCAILATQPRGPYAIAGYSYGGMLAFELSKALTTEGHEVLFTGSFNLPQHIAFRMQQLDWSSVLLHLMYFTGIISEGNAELMGPYMHALPCHALVLDAVMSAADASRLAQLELTEARIARWVDIAHGLQRMARDYEPRGKLAHGIDVFVADPLRQVAKDREEWKRTHLNRWAEHCEAEDDGLRLHDVEGCHYAMLAEGNVAGFSKILKTALRGRGL